MFCAVINDWRVRDASLHSTLSRVVPHMRAPSAGAGIDRGSMLSVGVVESEDMLPTPRGSFGRPRTAGSPVAAVSSIQVGLEAMPRPRELDRSGTATRQSDTRQRVITNVRRAVTMVRGTVRCCKASISASLMRMPGWGPSLASRHPCKPWPCYLVQNVTDLEVASVGSEDVEELESFSSIATPRPRLSPLTRSAASSEPIPAGQARTGEHGLARDS